MINVSVKSDLKKATKQLKDIQKKQIPFATALALTNTAKLIKLAEREEMAASFDRPKPYTLNSLYIKPANKHTLTAVVGLKDQASKGRTAAKYLLPQIKGGNRKLKAYEKLLKKRGILPNGYYTTPGKSAKLDRFGNISRGQLNQIFASIGSKAVTNNKSTKARYIIFPERDGKPGGIWLQKYGGLIPVLIFVKRPSFKKRYSFRKVARTTQQQVFAKEFEKAYQRAEMAAK